MISPTLSIVIPTCNEKSDGYLAKMVAQYPQSPDIEYIVVDSGSELLKNGLPGRQDFEIINLPASNRAQRLAAGLKQAKGPLVLFHHPRSLVANEGLVFLAKNYNRLSWGAFTHKFDQKSPGLRWTSWYSNVIRAKIFHIVYLDHCIFFRRQLLNAPIPEVPIFEDTEISKILNAAGGPQILSWDSTTSAIRFQTNGFWKQALLNQWMKINYLMGKDSQSMNQVYEKDLNLNE